MTFYIEAYEPGNGWRIVATRPTLAAAMSHACDYDCGSRVRWDIADAPPPDKAIDVMPTSIRNIMRKEAPSLRIV